MLAIIPARSGSKGLKDKNILSLKGKPLISYTIEAAINSEIFDNVFVSTDSEEYKNIAQGFGADIPFLRSSEISGDNASTTDAVIEALDNFRIMGKTYDTIAILQPTSPLRNHVHIKEAYDLFLSKKANAVVSLTEAEHSPLWCNKVKNDLNIDNFIELNNTPRQSLEKYYRINGAIYIAKTDYYLKYNNLYKEKCFAYIMEKKYSVDIDDIFDFKFAEFLLEQNMKI